MIYLHIFLVVSFIFVAIAKSQEEIPVNTLEDGDSSNEYLIDDQVNTSQKVDIQCYYECLCPGSREMYVDQIASIVNKISKYVTLQNYPYGNAETIINKDRTIDFQCQHGPEECYGNKLHACALDILSNATQAVLYNICMMGPKQPGDGSDDTAADKCGKSMSVDAKPIKDCAKSDKGTQLLKKYGEQTAKQNIQFVPWVVVNGELYQGPNLLQYVCAMIKYPPECNKA